MIRYFTDSDNIFTFIKMKIVYLFKFLSFFSVKFCLSIPDLFKVWPNKIIVTFVQSFTVVNLIMSFEEQSFENNPAILALKAEQLAIGTPTVDPTFVKHRKAPTANPLTRVRISKTVI